MNTKIVIRSCYITCVVYKEIRNGYIRSDTSIVMWWNIFKTYNILQAKYRLIHSLLRYSCIVLETFFILCLLISLFFREIEDSKYQTGNHIAFTPFPPADTFWCICNRQHLKTLWQKQKSLIISNYSICHYIFYSTQ